MGIRSRARGNDEVIRTARPRPRRAATATATLLAAALTLTACSASPGDGTEARSQQTSAKSRKGTPTLPVPRGKGARAARDTTAPPDFNGDGHPDLVLDELAKGSDDPQGDDAGIGIVYGSKRGLVPGARQLLSPARTAAEVEGVLPAAFDTEAACDLDGDGYTDLVVSTDPPFDGQGQPPVPVQVVFGGPEGPAGRAVVLRVPDRARFGNDWPDHPVCGDFDGDGEADLVLHASSSRLSFLQGPFTRKGAPAAAGTALPVPGDLPVGPAADLDGDGTSDLVVRAGGGRAKSRVVLGGPQGPTRPGPALPAATAHAFGHFAGARGRSGTAGLDTALATGDALRLRPAAPGLLATTVKTPASGPLAAGDTDGDGLTDLALAPAEGARAVAVLPGARNGFDADRAVTVTPPGGKGDAVQLLALADYDGDGRADLVLRTVHGATRDTVTVHPGTAKGTAARPSLSFTSADLLPR
ncbi:FG-GAP repeat domain-containing protein [Streptomyces albidoflavus]|uniref:FG-GAP repeat domain-containing protein n=1 Tax=Streptomyces albidoflavus TaxID=1886 RepID=UPI00214912AA|nr:VCBS repeat-containing protein [Streptomyces albidoflavus]MCR0988274.1 VCBS repeat-containing protein [Streptomyces albidoflavus]